MRLIIPIVYYRTGGVERVIVSLLEEFGQQLEKVVFLGNKKTNQIFQSKLSNSEKIIWEKLEWNDDQKSPKAKIAGFLNKIRKKSKKNKVPGYQKISKVIKQYNFNLRLNYVINKHGITHCLYPIANKVFVPKIKIPLGMITHDLFWKFAPMEYSEEYQKTYDDILLDWLRKAEIIFTVSENTRREIVQLFPGFDQKIKTVANSGFLSGTVPPTEVEKSEKTVFYFPSSFSLYKDHLTLLKAGLKLAETQHNFQIVLIGKDTDKLVGGEINLAQQRETAEYDAYQEKCRQLYQEKGDIIQQYFQGLGYCQSQEVEKWYQQSDCVVVPSTYEGFGLALSEAIIRGIPAIASDLDVFREQVELYQCSDRVQFFPPGEPEALASLMADFLAHPLPKLSQAEIEQRFSHWTWREAAEKYIQLLEAVSKS